MAIKRIDSYLDIPALKAEHQQLSEFLVDDYNSIVKLFNTISKAKGSQSLADTAKDAKNLDEAIKQTTKSSSELEKQKQKLVELQKKESAEVAFYKSQVAEVSKNLKIQAQAENAVAGSVEAARIKVKELAAQRDVVNVTTEKGKLKVAELNAEIDKQNEFIRTNVSLLEKQKINIGNYAGSFQEAFSALGTELKHIQSQIAGMGKDSSGLDALNKKADLIQKIMGSLNQSFGSTRQELRAATEAAKQLGTTFGITSNEFQSFVKGVGERKDELDDIQKTINFQASDTKYLDGVVNAVQGVVGAYGAYQAAAVLVGDDNKELQESMVKLQAVLTLVTSIQAVANSLQSESGTIQVALAAKAGFLAAAEKLVAVVTGERAAATTAAVVATETLAAADISLVAAETAVVDANTAAAVTSEVAAVGMETEAVAAGSLAAGLDTVVVAEGAVATGAVSMATAIAATGIGLIIIGIAIGIYKLVTAIQEWNAANESVVKANEALAGSLDELINSTKEYEAIRRYSNQQELEAAQKLIDKKKAAGVTSLQGLALDKEIAKQKKKIADDDASRYNITKESFENAYKLAKQDADIVRISESNKKKYIEQTTTVKDKDYEDTIKRMDESIAKRKDEAKASKDAFDFAAEVFQRQTQAQADTDLIATQEAKQNADDRRKYILESAKISAEFQTAANDRILNNDRTTLAQRLTALKSNYQERLKVIRAENAAVQSDPTVSGTDKALAAKKAAADIATATSESETNIFRLKEDFRIRDLNAQSDINKLLLQHTEELNKSLADNDLLSFNQRISAQENYLAAKQKINDEDYKKQLVDAGISEDEIAKLLADPTYRVKTSNKTNKEIEAITAAHYATKQQITLEGEQSITTIAISEYQKQIQANKEAFNQIDTDAQEYFLKAAKNYATDVTALNSALLANKISFKKYQQERLKIDEDHAKQITNIELEELKKQIDAYSYIPDAFLKSKEDLVTAQQTLSSAVTDDEKLQAAKQVEIAKKKYDTLAALDKQFTGLLIKYNEAETSADDKNKELKIKKEVELAALKKQIYTEVFNLAQTLGNAQFENELNHLANQKKASDDQYSKEVENINNSTLSAQQKADELAILDKEKETRDIQFAQRQKDIQIRQAKFARAMQIVNIIATTAQAVIAALAPPPVGLGPVFGVPVAAAAGVFGAVQLAAVLAKPIPQYAEGTDNHPGGHAIIGEGKFKEQVDLPGGRSFIADKPMMMNLPSGTKVKPLIGDEINSVMHSALLQSMASGLQYMHVNRNDNRDIISAVNQQTRILASALNKSKSVTKNIVKVDLAWQAYLMKNIYN